MTTVTVVLLLVGILAAAAVALLATVTAAIHREEHRLGLSAAPQAAAERLARRVLGAYVSEPYAARAFVGRHAAIGYQHPGPAMADVGEPAALCRKA